MSRSAFKISSRFAGTAASLSLAFVLNLSVSHQAMAACEPAGGGTLNNTYDDDVNNVVCDDDHLPSTNEATTANPNAVLNLLGGNDTLTVNGNPVFQNSTLLNDDGNFSQTIIDGGAGNDTFNFHGGEFRGAINGGVGDDTFNIDGGVYIGNIAAGDGNDLVIVTGDDVTFEGNFSQGIGNDRVFFYNGTSKGEFQNGAGTDYMFFFGGELANIEMQRTSVNSVTVIDGARVAELEMQNANSGNQFFAVNPTYYMRSGFVGVGQWGTANDSTVIIDPINSVKADSVDPTQIDALATAIAGTPKTGVEAMQIVFQQGFELNDQPHMLTIGEAEEGEEEPDEPGGGDAKIAMGNGNDTLTFIGAVNNGTGVHNLHFGEDDEPDEEEVPLIDGDGQPTPNAQVPATGGTAGSILPGTPGLHDRLNVLGGSDLLLGSIINFEHLAVAVESKLTLVGEDGVGNYTFSEEIEVDETSELHLLGTSFTIASSEFKLKGDGVSGSGRLEGLPDYYQTFATGGILRIGALPGSGEEDEEDVDGLAEEGGGDEDDEIGPATVTFNGDGSTYTNDGTIVMMNGVVGDTHIINDTYKSDGGNLAIDTELGDSDSDTDTLVINGDVTGTTVVYVANVGGNGAFTGQGDDDGIEIAASVSGDFEDDSFKLAVNAFTGREEVIGGAFSYQLVVTPDAALLQSDILDQVPAYATAPSVGQRLVSSGLDTLYKRLGEIRNGENSGATSADGLLWVRGNYADVDVDVDEGFNFSQRSSGVLAGFGGVIAGDGGARLAVGIFGSYGQADADVAAVIFGTGSESSIDVDGYAFGGYATYYERGRPGTGLYVDTVVKADFLDFDMGVRSRAAHGSADGDALTASGEIGYGFGMGGGLVLQPQAQIAYTDLTIDSFTDAVPYELSVSYGRSESLVGRLGLQVQATLPQAGGGVISPYAIFNVYSELEGNNRSDIEGTEFISDIGGTWYSAGGGVDAKLAGNVSFYGSGEYHFGDVEGWQGTGGLKLNW